MYVFRKSDLIRDFNPPSAWETIGQTRVPQLQYWLLRSRLVWQQNYTLNSEQNLEKLTVFHGAIFFIICFAELVVLIKIHYIVCLGAWLIFRVVSCKDTWRVSHLRIFTWVAYIAISSRDHAAAASAAAPAVSYDPAVLLHLSQQYKRLLRSW